MNAKRKLLPVSLAVGLALLGAGTPAPAQMQDSDQQKCINTMNKDGLKVAQNQTKGARKCIKDAGKVGSGTGTQTCIESNTKVSDSRLKTTSDEGSACTMAPNFGKTDATDVNDAAEKQSQVIYSEIFGYPADGAVASCLAMPDGKTDCKCQDAVAKDVAKLVKAQLKSYNKCKKDGLKLGIVDATGLEACMDTANADAKVATTFAKLGTDITGKCISPTSIATLFPGQCSGETTASLDDCLDNVVDCRICQMLNDMDGLNKDCDLYDDGANNESCAEYECNVGNSSQIVLNANMFDNFLTLSPINGLVNVDCSGQDGNNDKTCTCSVQSFDPIFVSVLGQYVCLTPGSTPCAAGKMDCNGGSAANADITSNGNIGACADNTSCSTACDAHCVTLGTAYSQQLSGCTHFCRGGANDNMACANDAACPGGACNGADSNPAGVCQCHCQATGLGADAGAGSLQCSLSVHLTLETSSSCDGTTIQQDLGDLCVPLTTATSSGIITNVNATMMGMIPTTPGAMTNTGTATSCSSSAAPKMRGVANFFGSSVGDLGTELFLDCR